MSQYINQPPIINFPQYELKKFIKKPKVNQIEIHHFSHRSSASLSIDGENLCFVSKVVLVMESGDSGEYKFDVNQQESVSSQSIQLQKKNINLPPELKFDSSIQGNSQECVEMAFVHLETHFGCNESDPSEVKVIHKV